MRLEITQSKQTPDSIRQVHEQFSNVLNRQAEQIEQLSQNLKSLQNEHRQLETVASRILEPVEMSLAGGDGTNACSPSGILAGVRRIAAATHAGQVLEALADEAARMGIRAVVFDVRGRVAWGASAGGYGHELPVNILRSLVVSLNQDGPFGQAFGSAQTVEARAADLEKNPNVLAKLTPPANARIFLIPVRSADSVVAILYAETGERRNSALVNSLNVLAEFAGAQIDRLLVVNGGLAAIVAAPGMVVAENTTEQADGDKAKTAPPEAIASPGTAAVVLSEAIPAETGGLQVQAEQALTASPAITPPSEEPAAPAEVVDIPHQKEEEEKVLRDARRFSKLLISEIELYNKNSLEEGRRNKDIYQRLKKDIDRSRETYEKRFAHTVADQFDYFYEELVRTLAENDPLLLGSGYSGPSV
ncbi:MAG TPA: hypothetical protein VNM47_15435 [Terriglobia bacterium]|nr:hypothetical protein [Terriglobia bacterium]